MPEVSGSIAAEIIGVSSQTIRRHVKNGLLKARLEGPKGFVKIDIADLRLFAEKYQYRFNEEIANRYTE